MGELTIHDLNMLTPPWCEACGSRAARYVLSTGLVGACLCGPCAMDAERRLVGVGNAQRMGVK